MIHRYRIVEKYYRGIISWEIQTLDSNGLFRKKLGKW